MQKSKKISNKMREDLTNENSVPIKDNEGY